MLITKELIKSLNPWDDMYENYVKFYGDESLTKAQFLGRKNIPHRDKLWVAFRLMTKGQVKAWCADITGSVPHVFASSVASYAVHAKAHVDNARDIAAYAVLANGIAHEKVIRKLILKHWKG